MRISILPKTTPGRWSVGLAAACILLFLLFQAIAVSVRHNPVTNPGPPNPAILIVVVADYIAGIAAFITGLTSIIKSRERSVLVISVLVLGAFFLIFILGEFLVPH